MNKASVAVQRFDFISMSFMLARSGSLKNDDVDMVFMCGQRIGNIVKTKTIALTSVGKP